MLIPIILSGGAGTRLWPTSRQAFPKPFMSLGGSPLLQQAIERGMACGTEDVMIVTNQDYLYLTKTLLKDIPDQPRASYLLEPKGRNTAPAIALAALACEATYGKDTVMLVLPADHLIPDTESFVTNVLEAKRHALQGQLVETRASGPIRSSCAGDVTADPAGRACVDRRSRQGDARGNHALSPTVRQDRRCQAIIRSGDVPRPRCFRRQHS